MYRGFGSFLGYLGGAQDYWLHGFLRLPVHGKGKSGTATYLDFCDGDQAAFNHTCWADDACGTEYYSTHLFARRAIELIEAQQGATMPMFLYLAWQSVHSVEGPDPEQLKAPQRYIDRFQDSIPNEQRRAFAAMTATLDEGVANVTQALKRTGLWDDTLVIFSTDNGGPADGYDKNMASNWPLRGTKGGLLEGGVRGVGVVSGGAVPAERRGMVLQGLIHVSDWFPTILSFVAQGGTGAQSGQLERTQQPSWRDLVTLQLREPPFALGDGQDMLAYLLGGSERGPSPRTEVLHEAHPLGSDDGVGNALRMGGE